MGEFANTVNFVVKRAKEEAQAASSLGLRGGDGGESKVSHALFGVLHNWDNRPAEGGKKHFCLSTSIAACSCLFAQL
jgi:hypothetical protein